MVTVGRVAILQSFRGYQECFDVAVGGELNTLELDCANIPTLVS